MLESHVFWGGGLVCGESTFQADSVPAVQTTQYIKLHPSPGKFNPKDSSKIRFRELSLHESHADKNVLSF